MKVFGGIKICLYLLTLLVVVVTNPTKDMNITHGHGEEYFTAKSQEAIEKQGLGEKSNKQTIVHIIPHSHDDVGWLKTLDQYFWGIHDSIQRANVFLILDSTITELELNPERKFTYVEMAFFMRWWEQQNDAKKESVKNLVREGRLEVINAGWSMNDEACPYYTQIIDNMMIGHKFLKEELGITAKIGWHIDPFGHSSANAALFADMGFDAFFYSRLDYQDKEKRLDEKSMEYIWRPFPEDNVDGKEIFTHAMFDHYYPPPGFCWATSTCGYYDEPIVGDDRLKTFNYKERVAEMYEWASHMSDHYRTNHLLIPMGGDFFYKNAHKIFINTDRLIEYFNQEYDDIKLIYSTPGNYIKAVHDSGVTFPVKHADQFPYAEKAFSYWTGYFSSRPVSKGNIRQLERYISLMNTQWTNTVLNRDASKDLKEKILVQSQEALRIVGVMQHHDAVTGTERQHVSDDYQAQMELVTNSTAKLNTEVIMSLLTKNFGKDIVKSAKACSKGQDQFLECPDELFDQDTDKTFIIFERNSDDAIVRIKLPHSQYKLVDIVSGEDVRHQMVHCLNQDYTDCRLEMQDQRSGFTIYALTKDETSPYLFELSG